MDPATISEPWMRAVCAAEALSFTSTRVLDNRAKRHRLTVGNGHGISGLIDAVKEETSLQPEISSSALDDETALDDAAASSKRKARTEWWHRAMQRAVREAAPGSGAPYTHPALLAAVDAIESVAVNEKVLVFGHYRAPMNALQHLLNARAMLRALDEGKVWPQSGLHSHEDRVALQVAHRQLFHREADLEAVEQKLQSGYRELENSRQRFRTGLLRKLKERWIRCLGRALPCRCRCSRMSTHPAAMPHPQSAHWQWLRGLWPITWRAKPKTRRQCSWPLRSLSLCRRLPTWIL